MKDGMGRGLPGGSDVKALAGSLVGMVALVAWLLTASAASPAGEPSAFGHAQSGSLLVVSGVLVAPRAVDMKGVWLDDTRPCSEKRTLKVSVELSYTSPSGTAKRVRKSRSGAVANCAEGGPNFGYSLRADGNGLACPNGTWKPGRYSFSTTTAETTTRLKATASLLWEKTGACS